MSEESLQKPSEKGQLSVVVSSQSGLAPKADKEMDMGAQFLAAHPEYADWTAEEGRKVVRKVDLIMLPIMTICLTLGAVDKILISNANLYGMHTVLHGQQYSWLGSIFYFGYLVMEVPTNLILQRFPIGTTAKIFYVFWVAMLMLMAACNNFASLATLRFLMGMGETTIFPTFTVLTTMFYTKSEQPLRYAIWFSGLSSLITGILSYGLGHAHTRIASWKLLFLVFGVVTAFFICFMIWLVPNSPMDCWWLTERERYIAVDRTKENRTGTKNSILKRYQVIEALKDYKTWLMAVVVFSFNVPNGALVTFAAQIVSGMGYGPLRTTLMGMPTGLFMTVSGFAVVLLTWWTPRRFMSISVAFIGAIPLICGVIIRTMRDQISKTSLLVVYYFFYCYWGPYVGMLSLCMANTSGYSKKTIINAVNFTSYCVANIAAPQFFKTSEAPTYPSGFVALYVFCVIGIAAILAYGAGCIIENKQRDAKYGVPESNYNPEEDSQDLTDQQKADVFRYSW